MRRQGRAWYESSRREHHIGQWFFRAHGEGVCAIGVAVAADDRGISLRGNGRTRRMSWATFANHWQPWQGAPMPRPTVLASGQLVWPTALTGVCALH